jgi:hypothetical protein
MTDGYVPNLTTIGPLRGISSSVQDLTLDNIQIDLPRLFVTEMGKSR